jgi:hypothetical protein
VLTSWQPRPCAFRQWSDYDRHTDCVNLGEVIGGRLHHAALALSLLFQFIVLLGEQVSHRVRWLELQGQHALCGEDAQQYLHSVF